MRMISEEKLNEIRSSVDIVDVISDYVSLSPKGKNYFGICPFHDDNNPSMSVSKEKQIYTCFSCGATGNVFKFIMDYENVSFIDAVKKVALKAGIPIDIKSNTKTVGKHQTLYDMYEISKKLYQNNLQTSKGKKAKQYLLDRSIDEETIKKFEIGYALKENDFLYNIFEKKKFSLKDMLESGLINQNNRGYNDVYYNRIVFPLYNLQGQVVAYSGRIYDTFDTAKYVNTKETSIFKKGELLYNYFRAKDACKKKKSVIVVEGFMDVIRLSTIGLDNVVAAMGTAITKNQILLLKKLSSNIILCFDGDKAGLKATISCMEQLQDIGISPKIIRLKDDLDPDEFVLKYGKEAFLDLIDNPTSMIDFNIERLKADKDLESSSGMANYVNDIIAVLNKIEDDVLREITLKKISKETGLDIEFLKGKIKVSKKSKKEVKKVIKRNKYEKAESYLIYYMLRNIEVIKRYERDITFMPTEKYRFLAREIDAFYHTYDIINIADLISYLSSDELIKTVGEIENLNLKEECSLEEIDDYIKTIRQYNVMNIKNDLKKKMAEETDPIKKASLAQKIVDLKLREEIDD